MISSVGMNNGDSIINDSSEHITYYENIKKLFKEGFTCYMTRINI